MTSLKQQVFKVLNNNSNLMVKELHNEHFPNESIDSINQYKSMWDKKIQGCKDYIENVSFDDLLNILKTACYRAFLTENPDIDYKWASLIFRLLKEVGYLKDLKSEEVEEWLNKAKDMDLNEVVDDMLGKTEKEESG